VTSNGFEGERSSTSYWLGAHVTVLDPDGRRPDGSSFVGSRFFADLPQVDGVGREATQRALDCIGSVKIPSLVCPLIVENRVSSRLVRALLGPMGGRALQQKQSFLEGKLGQAITSPLLTITDDPFIPKGFGSRHYDSDGISAKKFGVLEKGVLKNYYVDDYYGRKLGMAPTTSGPSNLVFGLGKKSLDELCAEVGEGILVTGFLGGNTNSITGDYSLGVQGFRIEKGKRTTPIGEMNISGNQLDLWKKLRALGNDPYTYSTMYTPCMVFDGVQFAGACGARPGGASRGAGGERPRARLSGCAGGRARSARRSAGVALRRAMGPHRTRWLSACNSVRSPRLNHAVLPIARLRATPDYAPRRSAWMGRGSRSASGDPVRAPKLVELRLAEEEHHVTAVEAGARHPG
jgi:hypothetical protein